MRRCTSGIASESVSAFLSTFSMSSKSLRTSGSLTWLNSHARSAGRVLSRIFCRLRVAPRRESLVIESTRILRCEFGMDCLYGVLVEDRCISGGLHRERCDAQLGSAADAQQSVLSLAPAPVRRIIQGRLPSVGRIIDAEIRSGSVGFDAGRKREDHASEQCDECCDGRAIDIAAGRRRHRQTCFREAIDGFRLFDHHRLDRTKLTGLRQVGFKNGVFIQAKFTRVATEKAANEYFRRHLVVTILLNTLEPNRLNA